MSKATKKGVAIAAFLDAMHAAFAPGARLRADLASQLDAEPIAKIQKRLQLMESVAETEPKEEETK